VGQQQEKMKAFTLGRTILTLCGAAVLLGLGCAGSKGSSNARGVSMKVLARADSIAARMFVAKKQERQAEILSRQGLQHFQACDSLLALLKKERKQASLAAADSLPANGATTAAPHEAAPSGNVRLRQLEIQATYNLQEARRHLEKSLRLNPFQLRTKHFLAASYKLLAERFPRTMSFDQPAHIWAELARVEPGEYLHFYNLGECYYAQRQWQEAWKNFKEVEEILLASTEVNDRRLWNPQLQPAATLDSVTLFYTIYYQGQCAIKRFDDKQALFNLERAKNFVNTPAILASIAEDIRWIKWDDGNILASVYRDSAYTLAAQGRYADAVQIHEKLLNEILRTKRARDEIIWDYAEIEYHQLHRKESAIARLDAALKTIPKDAEGAALDTTYNQDFASYGVMCYNLGIDTLRVNRRVAYDYFARAATIKWKERGKSYLQMAELAHSNADLSIRDGENALALAGQLNTEQLKKLYRLLIDSYRRRNQMDKAKSYFDILRSMR
jgi:tetratricopeptide (TPR) repeat protein